MDILSRIPAKSLHRFKSVSKHWYSLIQNPYFISLHRSRAQSYDCISATTTHESFIYLLSNQKSIQDVDLSFITSPHVIKDTWLYGSCNGLLCLFNQSDIVICNPAIREFRVLPQPPCQTWRTTNLGFVFDPKNNDYKVFRIATLFQSDLKPYDSYDDPYDAYDAKCNDTEVPPVDHKIQIYCMSTNSWKEIFAMVPNDRPCNNIGPCVSLDGVFYWLAFDFSTCVLVIHTFRMFEELFERLHFPDAFCFRLVAYLCVLKNSLALIQGKVDIQTRQTRFDIWVMDEYRVEESWTKKYTVGPLLGRDYRGLGFRPNVEVFLMSCDPGQMVSYNLSTGDINEYNQICGRQEAKSLVQVLSYSESLISVKIRVD